MNKIVLFLLLACLKTNGQHLIVKNQFSKAGDEFKNETSWEPLIAGDSVKVYISAVKYIGREEFEDETLLRIRLIAGSGIAQVLMLPDAVSFKDSAGNIWFPAYSSVDTAVWKQGVELNITLDSEHVNFFKGAMITKMEIYTIDEKEQFHVIDKSLTGKSQALIGNELRLVKGEGTRQLFAKRKIPDPTIQIDVQTEEN